MEISVPRTRLEEKEAVPSRKWLHEPLVHFILLGAAIFGIWSGFAKPGSASVATPTPGSQSSRNIFVNEVILRELLNNFVQNEGRKPSQNELNQLAESWVREEIMSREGLNNGLEKNDPVVRQRLAKLMQWYLVGASTGGEPGEAQLRRYYEENQERFRSGGDGLQFEQVFFSTARRGDTAETDARMTLRSFDAGKQTGLEVAIGHGDSMGGDKSLEEMQRGQPSELQALFGAPFVSTLQHLPFERWAGPFQSPLGWHVVRRLRPTQPTFAEMRPQIRSELIAARGDATPDGAYEKLRQKYTVDMATLAEVQK